MGNGPSLPKPPPPPPIHLLPKPKTIYYKVDGNNWFDTVNDTPGEGGWFNEFTVNTSTQGDPAYGCRKDFTSSYTCAQSATKEKTIDLAEEADGKTAIYNCSEEYNIAVNNRLQVDDDGTVKIWNAHTGEVLKSWQIDGNLNMKADQFKAAYSKFGRNYMEAGETLFTYTPGSNEYIGSPSGNIVVFLQWVEDGKSELRIGYPVASVSPDGRPDGLPTVGENSLWGAMGDIGQSQPGPNMSLLGPSMAAYKIIKFDGKEQSTSMNNNNLYIDYNLHKAMIPGEIINGLSDQYTYVGPFDQGRRHERTMLWGADKNSCQDTCNADSACWGFVYNLSDGSCSLKGEGMFPVDLNRRYNTEAEMYVRGINVDNDSSCPNNNTVVYQDVFGQMPDNPDMTSSTSCDLRRITTNQREVVAQKEKALMAAAKDVKTHANNLKGTNKELADKLIQQLEKYQDAIGDYSLVKKQIVKNQENYEQVNAMQNTSELEMISNNYQYLAFTGVAALGVIAAIKATN